MCREKPLLFIPHPYRKPTQVDEERILRPTPCFLIFDEYVAFFEMLGTKESVSLLSQLKKIVMLGRILIRWRASVWMA